MTLLNSHCIQKMRVMSCQCQATEEPPPSVYSTGGMARRFLFCNICLVRLPGSNDIKSVQIVHKNGWKHQSNVKKLGSEIRKEFSLKTWREVHNNEGSLEEDEDGDYCQYDEHYEDEYEPNDQNKFSRPKVLCMVCDEELLKVELKSHLQHKHRQCSFGCRMMNLDNEGVEKRCNLKFLSIDKISNHINRTHIFPPTTARELIKTKNISLPDNLTYALCKQCKPRRILISRTEVQLKHHLEIFHDRTTIVDGETFIFHCRICCDESAFASLQEVVGHLKNAHRRLTPRIFQHGTSQQKSRIKTQKRISDLQEPDKAKRMRIIFDTGFFSMAPVNKNLTTKLRNVLVIFRSLIKPRN